jgi:hypothetical protein
MSKAVKTTDAKVPTEAKKDAKATTAGKGESVAVAQTANIMDDLTKKQSFKKFSWQGKDINQLLAMNMPELS